ncbi:NADH-quinone oxidoreductase subunit E [Methylobacterium brachiatum]|jgi:NADH-quinone oxidoreductase subunit E|uniref:NADH-quinone oxidoreductase subunit E n=1 Tax=Methylobacterium brachiatum TaxID=269660 RepID=A0AAJ1WXK5_9HYPH|nr:NADH-quinone oxidoreductase subunit NuoE [Methylobacterium brachiatum]MCB4802731.1 NADH-quinone oxidoreductase subunit NuoE [Methylobacterium brachiatum]MDQ0543358.1 NADH-quinone oxidoreductase subunit E [Methylobacterium brachiatum]
MANRRLAPASEQPESFAFSPENAEWAKTQIAKYPEGRQASAVISLLWKAQEQNGGWLPRAAIEAVAAELGMPNIRVLEVATFYTMFALEPVGRFWIQVCGTVPCDSCGARGLKEMLEARLGPPGHVSPDGNFSWLEVECLGACCNAPMVQINQDYYEDLTPESLGTLMDDLAAGRPVKVGSQTGRNASEPLGGPDTLTDPALFDGSRVGAWRKRFEETAKPDDSAAKSDEAASTDRRAADQPKPARPDAGRPVERSVSDAPAQRAADGKIPVKEQDQADAAETGRSTAKEGAPRQGDADVQAAPAKAMSEGEQAGGDQGSQETPDRGTVPQQPEASGASEGEVAAEAEEARVAGALAALPKDATPEQKANAVGTRPPGLDGARAGKPDDLTRIKGVGPGNSQRLNALGIYHFDQIAAWTRDEITWVGTYLAFPGRIDRENWVGQAQSLSGTGN